MNTQSASVWTSDRDSENFWSSVWEKPEQNPRSASTTVNPSLVTPLAALASAINLRRESSDASLLPISSGFRMIRHLRADWVEVSVQAAQMPDVTPSLIEGLRSRFGFSDNALGELFGVSRQTVYNWRSKKTSADNPDRIRALAEILSAMSAEDAPYMQRAIFYPSADGRLIQDVLSDDGWAEGGYSAVEAFIGELATKVEQLKARDQRTIARLNHSSQSSMG